MLRVAILMLWTAYALTCVGQAINTGNDVVVNSITANNQQNPAVAVDSATGTYFVVWESLQSSSDYNVYGRIVNELGNPQGADFLVGNYSNGRFPQIAENASGQVVIIWSSNGVDGDGQGVFGRLATANGTLGTTFSVNSTTAKNQITPSVGISSNGSFVVVWASEGQDGDNFGIYGQRFSATGSKVGSEFLVNTSTSGYQGYPDVAVNHDGSFVVVWQSNGTDGSGNGIYGQRFAASGATVGSEFRVNNTTLENQQEPAVAIQSNGAFGVTWSSYGQDYAKYGVYACFYDSLGGVQNAEFKVNSLTEGNQGHADIATIASGDYFITYTNDTSLASLQGVYLATYLNTGSLLFSPTRINSRTSDNQQFSAITVYNKDTLLLVYQDGERLGTNTIDGDGYGIVSHLITIPPDITDPVAISKDLTIYLNEMGNVSINPEELDDESYDNRGITTFTASKTSFTCSDLGDNAVTLTVLDTSGNSSTATSTVTVVDTILPMAIAQDLTVYLNSSGNATITTGAVDNGSNDNCGTVSLQLDKTSFTCSNLGTNTVILTVEDVSDNTSTDTAIITVLDTALTLPTAAGFHTSDKTITVDGWTYFINCGDRHLLLALDLDGTGAVVPDTGVVIRIGGNKTRSWFTSGGFTTNSKGGAIIEKRWQAYATTSPTSNVGVKFYFTDSAYVALKDTLANHNGGATGYPTTISTPEDLSIFKITNNGNFWNPWQNPTQGVLLEHGTTPSTSVWVHNAYGDDHSATFMVSNLRQGGGIGAGGGGGSGTAALPVELIEFIANPADNHSAMLNWATASEINNSHFILERSYDGINFEPIIQVEGNGTTNEVMTYEYLDETISRSQNTVYYRLHQFDYDGASEYSEIRKVDFDLGLDLDAVNVYPNPFRNEVYVNIASNEREELTISLVSMQGELLGSQQAEAGSTTKLDLNDLASGVYFIQVTGEIIQHTHRVIKQ
jgi:hypothetical protein